MSWAQAASTTRRAERAPAWWPAVRGRPRRAAQRPLPSMMIATCGEVLCLIKLILKKRDGPRSALARRADQRLHVVEVALQRAPPGGREPVLYLGYAARKGFRARDVGPALQLAPGHAQISVPRLQPRLHS